MDKDKEIRMKVKIFAAIMAAEITTDTVNAAHRANRVFEILTNE